MKKTVRFAFVQTIPVMLGYLFLGFAFGFLLQTEGYSFWWAAASSIFIYAGSMQFVMVSLLSGGATLFHCALMTLFINGRHVFYGLSFVEKFKRMGKAYPYMIFSLTDETYSVLCNCRIPREMQEAKVCFLIALFDQCYWIAGSVLGGMAGQMITFDASGIDFSMTALFVVIFINQWYDARNHFPAIVGGVSGILCLLLLGPDKFIVPALGVSVCILLAFRRKTGEKEINGQCEAGEGRIQEQ